MKTVIYNAKIFDGDNTVIENGSLVFDETGILEVAAGRLEGDVAIDAEGRTLTPGLIDCHVHLGFTGIGNNTEPARAAARAAYQVGMLQKYGVTTVRNAGSETSADILVRDLLEAGVIKGCRVVAAGIPIGITGHMGYECDSIPELRKAVRTQVKLKADIIKIMATGSMGGKNSIAGVPQLTEEEIRVVVVEAENVGLHVMAHATSVRGREGARRCARAGVRSIEHVYIDDETARVMAENGTYYVPTIAARWHILNNTLPQYDYMRKKADPADLDRKKEALLLCRQYGIPVACGTDAGPDGVSALGPDTALEIGLYNQYGYTNIEALRTAMKTAARLLELENTIGTLTPGCQADLVLWEGDPLTDIAALKKPYATFQGGELVYSARGL